MPPRYELTLSLALNYKLVNSYLEYLKEVRKCSDGTIGETLTAVISCCRWLFRKDRSGQEWPIIRRYKDWRNNYQSRAARTRSQNDAQELAEGNKWLEWSRYTDLIQLLRNEWAEQPVVIGKATPTPLTHSSFRLTDQPHT